METTTLLTPTQTQTPDDDVICCTSSGTYTLLCIKQICSPVRIQVRAYGSETWQDAAFAGERIQLTEKDASVNLPIAPFCSYRAITETAGASDCDPGAAKLMQ